MSDLTSRRTFLGGVIALPFMFSIEYAPEKPDEKKNSTRVCIDNDDRKQYRSCDMPIRIEDLIFRSDSSRLIVPLGGATIEYAVKEATLFYRFYDI